MLDNLDICIVCVWKACRRLKQNSKDCQAFLVSHIDVALSSFWRSLLSLCRFCWASVDWVYQAMFWMKVSTRSPIINVYGVLLHHFHFVTGMPAGTLSQRPSGVDEGSCQSALCADVCGRTRAMKTTISHETFWKLVKESKVVWWCLTWFAFNWSPSVSFVFLFDLFWATNLQASLLSLSKDFQAWFSSVQAQQIMYLSEIVSC